MEVCRHLPPFSYIQQSQRHEEGFNLVVQIQHSYCLHIYSKSKFDKASLSIWKKNTNTCRYVLSCLKENCLLNSNTIKQNEYLMPTLVTGPVSLSLMQPCSMRLKDRQVAINLLPSFSSKGRTGVLSVDECSLRGLLRACG